MVGRAFNRVQTRAPIGSARRRRGDGPLCVPARVVGATLAFSASQQSSRQVVGAMVGFQMTNQELATAFNTISR